MCTVDNTALLDIEINMLSLNTDTDIYLASVLSVDNLVKTGQEDDKTFSKESC